MAGKYNPKIGGYNHYISTNNKKKDTQRVSHSYYNCKGCSKEVLIESSTTGFICHICNTYNSI